MRVFFGMETPLRERLGGHTGTAPTVSFGWIACSGWYRLRGLCVGRLVSFGWIACVILFVCWENGAHEPTPSVLYFCQPRVADDRRLPRVKSWRGIYAIGIVLFLINFRMGKSFANNPFAAVWWWCAMRKSTTPKGVASSLTSLPRVGCVALANPALSKV